jgi:hypothetical protein
MFFTPMMGGYVSRTIKGIANETKTKATIVSKVILATI